MGDIVNMLRHTGGACPCHPDALVTVTYANGYNSGKPCRAGALRWNNDPSFDPFNIVEYGVLEIPEGLRG